MGMLLVKLIYAGLLFYLLFVFYIGIQVYKDTKTASDAIVVLGAKSYKDDRYNPCLVSRVDHALSLYQQNYANTLIFSGGTDLEDNRNEAVTMQEIATSKGASTAAMLLEKNSTSTYENLLFTKQIMHQQNLNSVIIVTEPFHAPRAALVAKYLGLNYTISPTTTSPCWTRWKYLSRYFLREPLVLIKYKLEQKI